MAVAVAVAMAGGRYRIIAAARQTLRTGGPLSSSSLLTSSAEQQPFAGNDCPVIAYR